MLPTLRTLEYTLYLMLRMELDVLHAMSLPTGVNTNHCIRVCFRKDQDFFYQFIPLLPKGCKPATSVEEKEAIIHHLREQREYYFGWLGDGLGPCRLSLEEIVALGALHRTPLNAGPAVHPGDFKEYILHLASTHLYPSPSLQETA